MTVVASPPTASRVGTLVGRTLVGALLAGAGLLAAYLDLATPFVSWLVPNATAGGGRMPVGLGVWSFALIAAGALLVAGTNRLAIILTALRPDDRSRGPAARALSSMSHDMVVVRGVLGNEGRPIPELVLGAFGAAVIHELPSNRQVRRVGSGWEVQAGNEWRRMDDPIEAAIRDAERVRLWLTGADLDFVVRVHAALIVSDRALERVPGCAVIGPEQVAIWIASLPPQRTLTAGRRSRLLAIARPDTSATLRSETIGW